MSIIRSNFLSLFWFLPCMADFMFEDEVSDSQYGGGGSVQSDFLMSGSGLHELFHDVLFSLCISISIVQAVCVYAQSLSRVCLFEAPQTRAHQAPLSMEFPWQEYWSGLPFPPPGDLPYPGIVPTSSASPTWKLTGSSPRKACRLAQGPEF